MKKTFLWLSVAFASVIILTTSCKKSSSTPSQAVSATIGSTNFQGSAIVGVNYTTYNRMQVVASQVTSSDSLYLEIDFPDTLTVNKTYDMGGDPFGQALAYYIGSTQTWYSTTSEKVSGTLTLTSYDKNAKTVAGTFSLTIYGSGDTELEVKNGKFSSSYITED